jgi:hypothetical protein
MRIDHDKKKCFTKIPGRNLVSYRKILRDADLWSDRMLFNHLAAMRCSDQGFVTLDQLLFSVEIRTRASVQHVAQYKEATLVQQGPARDAFVAILSQQLADRLQDCREFIKNEKAVLDNKEPTASLTNLSAETVKQTHPAETKEVNQAPTMTTPEPSAKGTRRSKRIAAARSMTVVAEDPTVSSMGAEKARKLMLLARACAAKMDVAEDDKNLEGKEGEGSTLDSQLGCSEGESALDVIEERFYEYPVKVVVLSELGYLKELEQGVFLQIPNPSQRELHLDVSKLARWVQGGQRKQDTFENLLDDCRLFAFRNDIFCDDTFQQNLQTRATSNKNGEGPQTPPAIDRRTQITRDAYLAVVETGPDLRYDYPPMLEALVQLGSSSEYNKGIFKCVRDPQLQKKAFSLGALAT